MRALTTTGAAIRKPELLAPAGSPEGVRAAVQSGADAIYMGGTAFNARRRAKNFTEETLEECIRYCHLFGVRVYCTFNILIGDREMAEAARQLRLLGAMGADALIVQDPGAAKLCRAICPEMPLHASTQMALHDLPGILEAQKQGFSRVVLAREVPGEDLRLLCEQSPLEIETFVHGALCGALSGQCYMSALIGRRSGNRGLCAQPCRLEYTLEGKTAPIMSLKDLSMAKHLKTLGEMGVACLKIEGRMRRPEYTALVTSVYRRALDEGRCPTREETEQLRLMFSRDGFTDGFFTGRTVSKNTPPTPLMFGVKEDGPKNELEALCAAQRRVYETDQPRHVPVSCTFSAKSGAPMTLRVTDADGNTAEAAGAMAEAARTAATDPERVRQNVMKWGGTAFACKTAEVTLDENLAVPMSAVNALRRECAEKLAALRQRLPKDDPDCRKVTDALPEGFLPGRAHPEPKAPALYVQCETVSQALACPDAARTYLPVEVLAAEDGWQSLREVAAVLPRVIHPHQEPEICRMLETVREKGVSAVLAGNPGHFALAKAMGFAVYGDFGLNLYNSAAAGVLADMGFASLTASFELQWAAIRDLAKPVPTEAVVYGRLPLMVFENCLIRSRMGKCGCEKPRFLTDRRGERFLLLPGFGCRTRLFNGSPLVLWDRQEDYAALGLTAVRLLFTCETPAECREVWMRYTKESVPAEGDFTRGLYYRGVE